MCKLGFFLEITKSFGRKKTEKIRGILAKILFIIRKNDKFLSIPLSVNRRLSIGQKFIFLKAGHSETSV